MRNERGLHILFLGAAIVGLWAFFVPPDIEYRRDVVRDAFWSYKVFGDDRYDIVAAGDSRVYRGISPDDLAVALPGRRIFNFGFSSGILDGELLARAEEKLDPSGSRTLLIAITPHALTAKKNEQVAELLATPREERFMTRYGERVRLFFHRMSPKRFFELLSGGDIWKDTANYREEYERRTGWVASSYRQEKGFDETLRSYRAMRAKFPVIPARVAALRDTAAALRSRGVKVFFFYMPSSDPMQELEREWPGFDYAAIRRTLESVGAESLDGAVPTGLHSYDGSHLDERSARELSRALGRGMSGE